MTRFIGYLSTFFLLFTAFLQGADAPFAITYETLSADRLCKDEQYKALSQQIPGHHKTLLRLEKCPKANAYVVVIERSLLPPGNRKREHPVTWKELIANGMFLGEKAPAYAILSQGFLPGEKIQVTIKAKNRSASSKTFSLIPHPVVHLFQEDGARISAELVDARFTTYLFRFEGFAKGETIHFRSRSGNELLENDLSYSEQLSFFYSPGILGQPGGSSEVQFTRENGHTTTWHLPWGIEFIKYLHDTETKPLLSDFPTIRQQV